jgi:NAD(P)-dependent dehydrogenase (short-subunit alcohol dehydrogenase family)
MARQYKDKVVLVTGAAGGLGRALCLRYGEAGAKLGLMDLDQPGVEALADELAGRGVQAMALPGDITDQAACTRAVTDLVERFGALDLLINNAGLTQRSSFAETSVEVFRKVMDVNLFGALYCTKAALPHIMLRRGHIIAISSVAGLAPLYGRTGYAASKHAMVGLFSTLRSEMLEHGVGVTVACPGFIDTDFARRALDGDGSVTPHPRSTVGDAATPEQVAETIFRAGSRDQALLVLSPTGHLSRLMGTLAPGLFQRLMARALRKELER